MKLYLGIKSSRGFSLVELIVVIAIIGILATLVTPMYDKVAHRARQSEAKIQLSALHTAEKSFFAEYSAYHTAFQIIGYAPEGNVRYNIGFGAYGIVADASNGFNTPIGATWSISTRGHCGGAGGANTAGNSCNLLLGYDGLPAPPIPAVLTTYSDGYYAGAYIYAPANYAQLDDFFDNLDNVAQINLLNKVSPGMNLSLWGVRTYLGLNQRAIAAQGVVRRPDVCTAQYPCTTELDSNQISSDTWTIDQTGALTRMGPSVTCFSVMPTTPSSATPTAGVDSYPLYDCSSDPRLNTIIVPGGAQSL